MFGGSLPSSPPPCHWWQGVSGRWYYFSIYPITAIPSWIRDCNYIFARPRFDQNQTREPLYIGQKGDTDRFDNHEKLKPALQRGATELHVCFSAKSRWERLDIETDLRNRHWTPLNNQPTQAPEPVNALASLASFGASPYGGILDALRPWAPAPVAGFGGFATPGGFPQPNPFLTGLEPNKSLGVLQTLGIKPR